MMEAVQEPCEITKKMVNGNEVSFFHGHLFSFRHCQEYIAHYQKLRPAMVIDTDTHLFEYLRTGTACVREYFSKPPRIDTRYDDILCKRDIQNWFLRELAENERVWKAEKEPIIYHVHPVEKRNHSKLEHTASYLVANTYQTQLGLAAPNPQ